MAPIVIDLRQADDQRDAVHRAAQALTEGKLVAFPTDTVYGLAASALNADAVLRLQRARQQPAGQPMTLALQHGDELLDYAPDAHPLARRLARRCWPGPLTLLLPDRHLEGVIRQLPPPVQLAACPDGEMSLRVPGHPAVLSVLRYLAGPLVLTSASVHDQQDSLTAAEAVARIGEHVAMVLDDGEAKFAQRSSIIRVNSAGRLEVVRSGVVSEEALQRLSALVVLLVCTGNTCRSPMAEVLMKAKIASLLKTSIEDLEHHGVMVFSAGLASLAGDRAADAAVQTMAARGLDLTHHESQPITDRLVRFADLILTMTHGHRQAIIGHWPDTAPRVHTLCGERDLADPIGGSPDVYQQCADDIDVALDQWLPRLPLPKQELG